MKNLWLWTKSIQKPMRHMRKTGNHKQFLLFLTRLCKKGFASSVKKGRYHFYTPLISRQEYVKASYNLLISRFYHGDEDEMISEIKEANKNN